MEIAAERSRSIPRPDTLKEAVQLEAARQLPRLRRIPQRLDDLLGQASRGRLTARVSLFADEQDLGAITRLVDRAVLALLAAALGIGSALLLHATTGVRVSDSVSINEILGYIGMATAMVLMLRIVAAIIREGPT
jgi:ubiquinone biosynthesis protein